MVSIPEGVPLPARRLGVHLARLLFGILPVAVLVWIAVFVMGWLLIDYHRLGKDILAPSNNERRPHCRASIDRSRSCAFIIALARWRRLWPAEVGACNRWWPTWDKATS